MLPLFLVPIGYTLSEVLLAAAAGTVVKAIYDRITGREEAEYNRGKAHGEQRAKAAYEQKLQRLLQAVQATRADEKAYFNVILAVMTVGYTYAAARDGKVTPAIRTEITEFVIGQSQGHLPVELQNSLNKVAANPPDVTTARQVVLSLAPDCMRICDMLIAILEANPWESGNPQGHAFAVAWQQLKSKA